MDFSPLLAYTTLSNPSGVDGNVLFVVGMSFEDDRDDMIYPPATTIAATTTRHAMTIPTIAPVERPDHKGENHNRHVEHTRGKFEALFSIYKTLYRMFLFPTNKTRLILQALSWI